MDDRQIVRDALAHLEGKIPVDFGSTMVTGIHISCVEELRDYYGLEKRPVRVSDCCQMLGEIDDDLKEAMGVNTVGVNALNGMYGFKNEDYKEWRAPWGQDILVPGKFEIDHDKSKGGIYIYPQGDRDAAPSAFMPDDGYFFDTIVRQPDYDEDELDELDPEVNLEEFQDYTVEMLEHYEREVESTFATGRSVTLNFAGSGLGDIAHVPAPFLKDPKGIRDIEEWYISTAIREDYISEIFRRQTDVTLRNLQNLYARVGNKVDTVFLCGADFGTQNSTFCSADKFNSLWKPEYKRMTGWIHENTDWKVFKHSCGAIISLIPEILDAGFDILNPVQVSATGMDPETLKEKFGAKAIFWGGGVDTQKTLPFAGVDEVKSEVRRHCEIFGRNGGFVFNTVHNIQARTPVANIVALADELSEINKER